MARTQIWTLVVLIYFRVLLHSYTEGENLDELIMEPLAPFWYQGQPFDACQAIITKLFSYNMARLDYVSKKQCVIWRNLYINTWIMCHML